MQLRADVLPATHLGKVSHLLEERPMITMPRVFRLIFVSLIASAGCGDDPPAGPAPGPGAMAGSGGGSAGPAGTGGGAPSGARPAGAPVNDPAPGEYGTRAPLLERNSEMAVAELEGKVYVFGGYPTSPAADPPHLADLRPGHQQLEARHAGAGGAAPPDDRRGQRQAVQPGRPAQHQPGAGIRPGHRHGGTATACACPPRAAAARRRSSAARSTWWGRVRPA